MRAHCHWGPGCRATYVVSLWPRAAVHLPRHGACRQGRACQAVSLCICGPSREQRGQQPHFRRKAYSGVFCSHTFHLAGLLETSLKQRRGWEGGLPRESVLSVACLSQADEAAELEAKRALCPCLCAKQGSVSSCRSPPTMLSVDAGRHGATLRFHTDNLITAWPERLILPRPRKETWMGKQPLTTNTAVTATPHSGSVTSCLWGWLIGLLFSILLIC